MTCFVSREEKRNHETEEGKRSDKPVQEKRRKRDERKEGETLLRRCAREKSVPKSPGSLKSPTRGRGDSAAATRCGQANPANEEEKEDEGCGKGLKRTRSGTPGCALISCLIKRTPKRAASCRGKKPTHCEASKPAAAVTRHRASRKEETRALLDSPPPSHSWPRGPSASR